MGLPRLILPDSAVLGHRDVIGAGVGPADLPLLRRLCAEPDRCQLVKDPGRTVGVAVKGNNRPAAR
jgi:hypothetical protein